LSDSDDDFAEAPPAGFGVARAPPAQQLHQADERAATAEQQQ